MKKLQITKLDAGIAYAVGIHTGDYLDSYNGKPINSSPDLSSLMKDYAGQKHTLNLIRDYEILSIDIVAGVLGITVEEADFDENTFLKFRTMELSTTPFIPGHKVTKALDVVTAECVFGMNILKDFFTSMSDTFGGRSETTQRVLRDAKRTCIKELKLEAIKHGATGIVGIDLDYSELSGQGKSMLLLVASGTAVLTEPEASA